MATVGKHNTRRKNKLLKYLPKAASAVTFQGPIYSPGREKNRLFLSSSGFSGPIVSIIPDEARRRPRKSATRADEDDAEFVGGLGTTQEPSSPKVSCIGQIKLHKEKKKKKNNKKIHASHVEKDKGEKKESRIRKMFGFKSRSCRSISVKTEGSTKSEAEPSIGQMKRYTSGRQSLANFDWSAQIAPVSDLEDRNCHSDEEFGRYGDEEEEEEEEEEVMIPFSAPMVMGMTEQRKEVNLWQRRNTTSPPPLQLKTLLGL